MEKAGVKELVQFSKTLNILYVEDNEEARKQTLKMLDNFFENIIVAVDGADGIKKFEQNNVDLIITDINMPIKNGLDMLRDIKKLDDEVFCLIISAHNESDYFIEAIELGVDGFLLKPVKIDQFPTLIFKTVGRIKNAKDVQDIAIRQAKLASMGEMIDSIAHQWKQPLSVISIKLQILDMALEMDTLTNEKIKDAIDTGDLQIKHLLETMEEFRAFFRVNTKKETVTLKSIVDSALFLVKDELLKNSVKVEVVGDNYLEVELNANEFKHVIINIINNSKDAFVDNNIDVHNRKIIFDIKNKDNKSALSILDNAGGIPKIIIDNIFKANFTTKEKGNGTGIGLYMTKHIVEKIDATINVTNINNGACFTILI